MGRRSGNGVEAEKHWDREEQKARNGEKGGSLGTHGREGGRGKE